MQSSKLQATPGKLICRLRVVDVQGRRIGFMRASARFLTSLLSGALFGIGYLMVAWSTRKLALHDRIARTLVLRRRPPTAVELPLPG